MELSGLEIDKLSDLNLRKQTAPFVSPYNIDRNMNSLQYMKWILHIFA